MSQFVLHQSGSNRSAAAADQERSGRALMQTMRFVVARKWSSSADAFSKSVARLLAGRVSTAEQCSGAAPASGPREARPVPLQSPAPARRSTSQSCVDDCNCRQRSEADAPGGRRAQGHAAPR